VTLVPIAEYPDRIAADVARIGLAAQGIEALLFDGGMADLGLGFMTPVRLMVHKDDADRARALIEAA
jgi:hypothetical protein